MHNSRKCIWCCWLTANDLRAQRAMDLLIDWSRTPPDQSAWHSLVIPFAQWCICSAFVKLLWLPTIGCRLSRQFDQTRYQVLTLYDELERQRAHHELRLAEQVAQWQTKMDSLEPIVLERRNMKKETMIPFDHKGFWESFPADIKAAEKHVLIVCPFVAVARIDELKPSLSDAILRGVQIVVVTRPLAKQDLQAKDAVELLERLGIRVEYMPNIHQKLVFIDDDILWEGSMNVLKHFEHQREHMRRINDAETSRATRNLHGLRFDGPAA